MKDNKNDLRKNYILKQISDLDNFEEKHMINNLTASNNRWEKDFRDSLQKTLKKSKSNDHLTKKSASKSGTFYKNNENGLLSTKETFHQPSKTNSNLNTAKKSLFL